MESTGSGRFNKVLPKALRRKGGASEGEPAAEPREKDCVVM